MDRPATNAPWLRMPFVRYGCRMDPTVSGAANCPSCHGRGGWRDGFGWHRCHCTRPTKAAQDALRKANQRDDKPYQLNLLKPEGR